MSNRTCRRVGCKEKLPPTRYFYCKSCVEAGTEEEMQVADELPIVKKSNVQKTKKKAA